MTPSSQESHNESPTVSPFHQLIPDCRKLILSYHFHGIWEPTPASDLKFAMKYFTCEAILHSEALTKLPSLGHLHSWNLIGDHNNSPGIFRRLGNLRELRITDNGDFGDEIFQHLGWLEVLCIKGDPQRGKFTSEIFTHLKHLRELDIEKSNLFTDKMFQNLYKAGSRLERLRICGCSRISDVGFSFFEGEALRELGISCCGQVTGEGLKHLRGVQHLILRGMNLPDFHHVVRCLEGSVQSLILVDCSVSGFDEEAMSTLRGISTLALQSSRIEDITDAAFHHLAGSIKQLEIINCRGTDKLSKNLLWHLSGIEHVELDNEGIWIEAEDLPRLKEVFRHVSWCEIGMDFADDDTLEELQEYVEGIGSLFAFRRRCPF